MATVDDVAGYVLAKLGAMSAYKLQKLVYYSQAWHLAWEEVPLFSERIEAWANGPVCPTLYKHHQGMFKIQPPWGYGNAAHLTESERESVDAVLAYYGDKSPQWLSDLTHMEDPWIKAREGLAPAERGNAEITQTSMFEFYQALSMDPSAH